jgi:hypothetical protein
MIAQLLTYRLASAFAATICAVVCLWVGLWMSLRPNYWATLASQLVPESIRKEPNPFAPAKSWRFAGQLIVSLGLALTGISLWLMITMASPV